MTAKRFFFLISSVVILSQVTLVFPISTRAQTYYEEDLSCKFGNATSVPTTASTDFYNNRSNFDQLESWQLDYAYSSASPYTAVSYPSYIGAGSEAVYKCQFGPSAYGIYNGGQLEFDYYNNNTGDSLTVYINLSGAYGVGGFINPKYIVLGAEYAPPGAPSYAKYGTDTVVGSSFSIADSFSTQVTQSVSLSSGPGSPSGIFGFSSSQTSTQSTSYTQENDTSSTIAVSQMTSYTTQLNGQLSSGGVNHDYDYIYVWLNPTVNLFVVPGSSDYIQWNGYGFDLNDDAGEMEVIGLELGWLNGDIPMPTCAPGVGCVSDRLARRWSQNNVDGSGPGLTSTDLANIAKADPFYTSYTLSFPSGSNTTTDGRFTCIGGVACQATVDFEPNVTNSYSQTYTTTASYSQTSKFTFQQTFSIERQFQGTIFDNHITSDLKNSTQLTWSSQFNQSTNNSNGQTSSFSIGPAPQGYNGPAEFRVFQDNLYGTFMFWPVQ
ncbi:MAG: hypothetical protein ACYC92_01095 [Candidatus Acidiferrales bacterium]